MSIFKRFHIYHALHTSLVFGTFSKTSVFIYKTFVHNIIIKSIHSGAFLQNHPHAPFASKLPAGENFPPPFILKLDTLDHSVFVTILLQCDPYGFYHRYFASFFFPSEERAFLCSCHRGSWIFNLQHISFLTSLNSKASVGKKKNVLLSKGRAVLIF